MTGLIVRGECIRCGLLLPYGEPGDDYPAYVFLTIPGRGIFRGTVFKAELVCKNQSQCAERQRAEQQKLTDDIQS